MSDKNDKRLLRKKGEFSEQKKIRQRQASIYNKLNIACKKVMEKNTEGSFINLDPIEVIIDNKKFLLSNTPVLCGYYTPAFIRLKNRGLVLVSCYGSSYEVILPYSAYVTNDYTIIKNGVAAYVIGIEFLHSGKLNSNSMKRVLSMKNDIDSNKIT